MDLNTLLTVFLSALVAGTLLIVSLVVLFYVKCVKPELDTMKKSPTKEKAVVSPPIPSLPFMMSNAGAEPPSPLSSSASYVTVIKKDANCFTYSGPLQQLSVGDRNIIYSISNSLTCNSPESKHYSSVAMQGVAPENIYSRVGLSQSSRGAAQRPDEPRANNETIYARIRSSPALPLRQDYTRMQSSVLCSSPLERYTDMQSSPSFASRAEKSRLQTPTPRTHLEESISKQTPIPRTHLEESIFKQTPTPRTHLEESIFKQTPTHRIYRQEYTRMEPQTHRNEQVRRHPPNPRTPRTPLDEYASMQVRFPFPNDVEYTCMRSPLSSPGRDHQPRVDTMDDSEIELGGSAATILGTGERNNKVLDYTLQGGSLHRINPSGPCKPICTVTRSDTIPRGAVKTPINAAIEHLGAQQKLQLSRGGEDGKTSLKGLSRITSKPFFRSSFKGKQACLPATSEFTFESYRIADYSFVPPAPPIPPPVQSSENNKHSRQSLTTKFTAESFTDESLASSFYSGLPLDQTKDTSVAIEKVAHETIVRCDPTYASIKRSRAGGSGRVCMTVETPSVNKLTLRREKVNDEVDSNELNRISCLSEISCIPKSSSSDHSYTSISVPGTSIADDSNLRRISETQISLSTSLVVHDTSPLSDSEHVWMRTSSLASTIFQNTTEVPGPHVSVFRGEMSSNKQPNAHSNQQRVSIPSSDASEVAQKIARCKDVVQVHRKKAGDVKSSVSGPGLATKEQESEPVAEGDEGLEPAVTTADKTTQSGRSGNSLPDAKIASSCQAETPASSSSIMKSTADQKESNKFSLGSNSNEVVEHDLNAHIEDVFRNMKNTTHVTHL